jgi:hypothetical protein
LIAQLQIKLPLNSDLFFSMLIYFRQFKFNYGIHSAGIAGDRHRERAPVYSCRLGEEA